MIKFFIYRFVFYRDIDLVLFVKNFRYYYDRLKVKGFLLEFYVEQDVVLWKLFWI